MVGIRRLNSVVAHPLHVIGNPGVCTSCIAVVHKIVHKASIGTTEGMVRALLPVAIAENESKLIRGKGLLSYPLRCLEYLNSRAIYFIWKGFSVPVPQIILYVQS